MKRRETKFVHGSPRLVPEGINAAPRIREEQPRGSRRAKGMQGKTAGAGRTRKRS